MRRVYYTRITEDIVSAVFSKDSSTRKQFPRPLMAENICRQRAQGADLAVIGKKVGHSATFCGNVIRKAIRLYKMMEA